MFSEYTNYLSPTTFVRLTRGVVLGMMLLTGMGSQAQTVTEIITDYNGFWKSGAGAINPVYPDNSHHLVSFTANGTRYSTGVNDALLTANAEQFVPGIFRALPMQNLNGSPNSNTKIGLGAMADGVASGAGAQAPSRSLNGYLSDGQNGLDMGTCVANLPAGTMYMSVTNLILSNLGDGVPDILVTQVADPSTSKYDRYEFTDINGNPVGNYVDVVLTNIPPVGVWTADFYEATGSTILASGFTRTNRNIRLWAADFSAFGIDSSNISSIAYFKIGLSGDSDVAFVAYNTTTVSVNLTLSLPDMRAAGAGLRRTVERSTSNDLVVYPNPAGNFFNLTHPVSAGGERITLFNALGVPILHKKSYYWCHSHPCSYSGNEYRNLPCCVFRQPQ